MFILSYETDNNGVFKAYGKEIAEPLSTGPDYGVKGMLLKISPDGETAGEHIVLSNSSFLLDKLSYFAVPNMRNEALLLHNLTRERTDNPGYQLYKVSVDTGKIITESDFFEGETADSRVIPSGENFLIAVSSIENGSPVLRIFDNCLHEIKAIECIAPLSLGPLLFSKGDGFRLFFLQDGEVWSLDSNMVPRIELSSKYQQAVFFQNKGPKLLLYRDDNIEIFPLLR